MTTKTLENLQKQNNSIYNNLISRNIPFERNIIEQNIDIEEQIKILTDENNRLKETVKNNKPPPPTTPLPKTLPQQNNKPKEIKENNEEEDEEEYNKEPIKKYNTITNMEELKRAFFSNDNIIFEEQLRQHNFKFYKGNYKYNSDKDGAPEFSARNLLKGFVRSFDDYRKYFMICFRCWKNSTNNDSITYEYNSYWIVNTTENIRDITDVCDDFEFEEIDIDVLISCIQKTNFEENDNTEEENIKCIAESYVH